MARPKPDPNEETARIVPATTGRPDDLPADAEAAWEALIARIHSCDDRTRTLLRAAFEAGVDAGKLVSPGSALGRLGASKGGQARAASLSKKRRVEIAKKAAKKRWGD